MEERRQKEPATLKEMQAWAADTMASRPYDLDIGTDDSPFMLRWWVIPRNHYQNVYLHKILRSDDPRALHDHPWKSTSIILAGRYLEITPEGSFERVIGDIVTRKPTDAHRLELIDNQPCISLFLTGPVVRDWGFHCPQGWRSHEDYQRGAGHGRIGRGCGE